MSGHDSRSAEELKPYRIRRYVLFGFGTFLVLGIVIGLLALWRPLHWLEGYPGVVLSAILAAGYEVWEYRTDRRRYEQALLSEMAGQ